MEKVDATLPSQEVPNWWVFKPVDSIKSLADLLFVPTSLMRKIDWEKSKEVFEKEKSPIWPLYALIGTGELGRVAIYGLDVYHNYQSYVNLAKLLYEKLQ